MTGKITEIGLQTEERKRNNFINQELKTIDRIRRNYTDYQYDKTNFFENLPYEFPNENIGLCLNHKIRELYQEFKKAELNYFYSNICGMAITRDLLNRVDEGLTPYNRLLACSSDINKSILRHRELQYSSFLKKLGFFIMHPSYGSDYPEYMNSKKTQFNALKKSYLLSCESLDNYSLKEHLSGALTRFLVKEIKPQDVRDLYYDEVIDTYTKLGMADQLPDLKTSIELAYKSHNRSAIINLKRLGINNYSQFIPNLGVQPKTNSKPITGYSEMFNGLQNIEIKNEDIT